MRVSFRHADFEALANLWNSFYPERYVMTPKLFEANTVSCKTFDWGASAIELDESLRPIGFVSVKRSAFGFYPGPIRDLAHLSSIAFADPQIGVDLMQYAKQVLNQRGIAQLRFGQDLNHFFPGCPLEFGQLKDFLLIEGFDEGEPISDVLLDLEDYTFSPKAVANVRQCQADDVAELDQFFQEEFPGRWRHDCLNHVESQGDPSAIDVLCVDGEIRGFSLTQDASTIHPISGAVWSSALGPDWCALGPIGISKGVRGQGLGDALLAGSLSRLKSSGKRNCLIDWTNLTDWYGKHGFEPVTTYLPFTLDLRL
ncbi:MAG: GNAT family N-acetyltransferase [Fimbriimonadaceae bacterium]